MPEPDDRIMAYLLDELPETERAAMEEAYLASDAAIAPFLAIEAQLYDDYARGNLSAERRRLFERKFLQTPEQRRKLDIARALWDYPQSPQLRSTLLLFRRPRLMAAVATAIILLAVTMWHSIGRIPNSKSSGGAANNREPIIAAFTLGPGTTRDGGREQVLDIVGAATLVRLSAYLGPGYMPPYAAVLKTPDGIEVWREGGLQPPAENSRTLTFAIPASSFASGHYLLTVTDTAGAGIADYAFRVQRF